MENVKFKGGTTTNEKKSKTVTGLQRAFEEIAELREQIKILYLRIDRLNDDKNLNERQQRHQFVKQIIDAKFELFDSDIVPLSHFIETGEWIGRFEDMERRNLYYREKHQGKDIQQQ